MNVTVVIRNTVVSPVMSYPPQGPTLRRAGSKPGSRELGNSPGLEGVVAEFSLVAAGNSEASHYVNHDRDG